MVTEEVEEPSRGKEAASLQNLALASTLQVPSGLVSLTTLGLRAWKVLGWEVDLKALQGWQLLIAEGSGVVTFEG